MDVMALNEISQSSDFNVEVMQEVCWIIIATRLHLQQWRFFKYLSEQRNYRSKINKILLQ